MIRMFGRGALDGASLSDNRGGPWGSGDGDEGGSGGEGPRNPWGPRRRRPGSGGGGIGGGPGPIDEFLKRSRERFGGGFPRDGRPYWLYGLIAFLLLWVLFTSVWRIGPQERGVVQTLGSYSYTMGPGVGFSWPAPFGKVTRLDVEEIRTTPIPGSGENLILTGDYNVIDLAYSVRWNIKNPELYAFRIADPETTIKEVAESAMRSVVARVTLDDAIGAGRATSSSGSSRACSNCSTLRLGRAGPGRRDQPVRPARGGQRRLPRSLRRAAARAERDQQCPRLCAADDRARAGRGGGVRQDLCPISSGPRGDPPAALLRDDGAGPPSASTRRSSRRRASRPICRCPSYSAGGRPRPSRRGRRRNDPTSPATRSCSASSSSCC
jgi:hypothetical protein